MLTLLVRLCSQEELKKIRQDHKRQDSKKEIPQALHPAYAVSDRLEFVCISIILSLFNSVPPVPFFFSTLPKKLLLGAVCYVGEAENHVAAAVLVPLTKTLG